MKKIFVLERRFCILFLTAVLLVACVPSPSTPTALSPPSATLTSTPFLPASPTSTPTPKPTRTSSPTLIQPPTAIVAGLMMRAYQVVGTPELDSIHFATVQGGGFDYQRILALSDSDYFPDNSFFHGMNFSMWIEMGEDRLLAAEEIPNGLESASVVVTRNGDEIYRVSGHHPGVTMALRGFWMYNNHWVLEVGFLKNGKFPIIGQIIEDGVILNDKYGYEEAFGFQTIHGRPFYFFKQDGFINVWYDGQEIPLNYEKIPYYGCCSSAELNPYMWMDMVAFFGIRNGTWYFVQTGVPDSFVP